MKKATVILKIAEIPLLDDETVQHHVEYAEAKWINGESIEAFLKQLIKSKPEAKKTHIIRDNAGYHKSQAIRDCVKTTNIELHFLRKCLTLIFCLKTE
jgi:hypothetical protein